MKKRLLVTISFSFSIRYLYRTCMLSRLRQVADVVIAITWNEPELIAELRNDGYEVHIVPESRTGTVYDTARKRVQYWFTFFRLRNSRRIQEKYLNQFSSRKAVVIKWFRAKYNYLKFLLPGYTQKVFRAEEKALVTDTNFNDMVALVQSLNVDAVLSVTPFHPQEDILLRACKHLGKQMLASILSFDNITKRGWMPVLYDTYLVWNHHNQEQAYRIYPQLKGRNNVHVVGAPQFDFYYKPDYLLPRQAWQQLVGLPSTQQKIILYAGGPGSLFPNEPQYLKHLLEAIDAGEILGNPLVLFRCHPVDSMNKWLSFVGEHPNLVYDNSWTGSKKLQYSNITRSDIEKLCSTLAYTDVHINLCSTMTVDGSAFNKPQIGPYYDDVNPAAQHLLRNMYNQEHFKPIVHSGALYFAHSRRQLVQLVNDALIHPKKYTTNNNTVLQQIITYTDGKSTERALEVLKTALA